MKLIKDKKYIALIDIYDDKREIMVRVGEIVSPITVDKKLVHLNGRPSIDYTLFQDCFDEYWGAN